MIVVSYVQDLLVFTKIEKDINQFREQIQAQFIIRDRGEASQFLGMEIKWHKVERELGLRQTKLIE